MGLRLRDTLTGRIRAVRLRRGRPVSLYVCGPTVYAPSHVGHARTYLDFDLLRRTLEADGRRVRHVMNITDFEDKIEVRAEELGTTWRALARREEATFVRDLDSLDVLRAHVRPRASDFIQRMIRVGRQLERTGRVQRQDDSWIYFPPSRARGRNFPIANDLASHAVREPSHPFPAAESQQGEFMVWKRQEPPYPSWPSPWGRGVPGWHLECYAMAQRYLGIPVDVHGGGRDLIFPHHFAENEIALALDGQRFSQLYLHTAFVLQGGSKMAKSTGNLVTIRDAVAHGSAAGLRWYLIGLPYSQPVEWIGADYRRAVREFTSVRETLRRWLAPGGGGTVGAAAAQRLADGVQRDLTADLRSDHALERIREFAARLRRDPSERVARGESVAARSALRAVEARTGLELL
jgi:cysteinyl-tRNA synthetase